MHDFCPILLLPGTLLVPFYAFILVHLLIFPNNIQSIHQSCHLIDLFPIVSMGTHAIPRTLKHPNWLCVHLFEWLKSLVMETPLYGTLIHRLGKMRYGLVSVPALVFPSAVIVVIVRSTTVDTQVQ